MKYKTIVFEDGSNAYICKTVEEFEKMSNKYNLEPTGTPDFYVKRKEMHEISYPDYKIL